MGAQGQTTIDFGAFPGKSDASVAVTGQAAIVAGSLVEAWIRPEATADHSADEHMMETLKVFAGNIVAGTGFTIYALNTSQLNEPLEAPGWNRLRLNATVVNQPTFSPAPSIGGRGTLIYGQWTVAWAWN
jgi:hypothetical protein